jgi:hypothetical protein
MVPTTQKFYMNEISSTDFPQHGEVFYFYGQALKRYNISPPLAFIKEIVNGIGN